ncbi:unnamed protein product [Caenorhabditis nigoni]
MTKSNPVTPNKQPPEDWNQLLNEFIQKSGRGLQKTFIKKLWAVHEDILENANPSILRMMFFSTALTVCPEGVKLVAAILFKIGVANGMTLVEKNMTKYDMTDAECQRYGQVFTTAWLDAFQEGEFDLAEEMENDIIRVICQNALYAQKPLGSKFRKMLVPFATSKKQEVSVDEMISRILEGCLWRALESSNYIVQSAASEVFFMFFPLTGEDKENMEKLMANQYRYISDLLQSDIVPIRTEAIPRAMRTLGDYWFIIDKAVAKQLMTYIIDTLARDSVVGVRVAVYEGLNEIAFNPNCINAFEHGFKCAAKNGVIDSSERVRLAAFQCLAKMKNHKFISCFDIMHRDDMISVLDLENVEDCRKQLIPIIHIFIPISKSLDEAHYRPRVNYMLDKSRIALLSYFRLLGPLKIIDGEQAEALISMFNRWAYRLIRKKDQTELTETSEGFRRARAYLECSLIIYMSCKRILIFDCEPTVKAKIDQMFGKIVQQIFENYGNTPLLGTATAISSVIPKEHLKTVAADVLARLADDEVPEEAVEPFLESAIHFNPESVFDSLSNGLNVFSDLYGEQPKQSKKKKRDVGDPNETLQTTLGRLKYVVQSHSTSSLLASNDTFKPKILDLEKKIDLVREAIEKCLAKEENEENALSDDNLLLALEFRFILPLYAVSENNQDEAERKMIIDSTKDLLRWFQNNVAGNMSQVGEHNMEFFIKLSCSFLNCITVALSAYDFKTRPVEYEDEEDAENQSPEDKEREEEDETTVAQLISEITTSFSNSNTPAEIFVPILRVGAILCEESYSETHTAMARLLRFTPKWLNKQCSDLGDDEFSLDQEKEIADGIRQLHKKVNETDQWDEEMADKLFSHCLGFAVTSITDEYDDEEFEDPRSEDYKPPLFISLAVIKWILKDKILANEFFDTFYKNCLSDGAKMLPESEGQSETKRKLTDLAIVSHFLRILEKYSKTNEQQIKKGIETCTTRVLDCFANASDLDTVDNSIMNSISKILDVDLPDGY